LGLMDDASKTLKPWVTFAGCVLVVVVLYWAQAVLVPFAVAILLTFVVTPPVTWLQRWVGRVPAVLAVVTLVFAVLGLTGWGLARQMDHLAACTSVVSGTGIRGISTSPARYVRVSTSVEATRLAPVSRSTCVLSSASADGAHRPTRTRTSGSAARSLLTR
jgi:hypothetical protein